MRANMPVALIENASLPEQRTCLSDLQQMQQAALDFQLKSPAILLIGEVAQRSALPVMAAELPMAFAAL